MPTQRVIVCGSGRCGSSMLMWMLHEGGKQLGLQATGDFPYWEDTRAGKTLDIDWLQQLEGFAKTLDPHRYYPADMQLENTKAIWVDRDKKQQARSWRKLSEAKVKRQETNNVSTIAKLLKQSRREAHACIKQTVGELPLVVTYEQVLANPTQAAEQIAKHTGLPLDVDAMAAVVIPRPAACTKGMIEDDLTKLGADGSKLMIADMRNRGGVRTIQL